MLLLKVKARDGGLITSTCNPLRPHDLFPGLHASSPAFATHLSPYRSQRNTLKQQLADGPPHLKTLR